MDLARLARWSMVVIGATSVACGVGEDVIAKVGDHEIDVASLQVYLEGVTATSWQEVERRVASRLLDQLIDQEVVAAAAKGRPSSAIPEDPAARSAAVRSLLREVCGPVPAVSQDVLDHEIARRLEQAQPARAHVRQLLLKSLEEAEAARERLNQGEEFERISLEASRAPNAEGGGELGYVVQGTLPQDLDEVIFAMEPGTTSQPVPSPAGYHIFQVLEVIPEGPLRRAEVEIAARRDLSEASARDFARECVDGLAAEVGVSMYRTHLWFQYEGRYGREDEP
jgi:parvulin-like peptidyl-prolyl isomerase